MKTDYRNKNAICDGFIKVDLQVIGQCTERTAELIRVLNMQIKQNSLYALHAEAERLYADSSQGSSGGSSNAFQQRTIQVDDASGIIIHFAVNLKKSFMESALQAALDGFVASLKLDSFVQQYERRHGRLDQISDLGDALPEDTRGFAAHDAIPSR